MSLVYPVMVQILLTFVVLILTGRARVRALKERRTTLADVALNSAAWPDDVRKFGNNYANQFETPVLFYVLVLLAIYLGATGSVMTLLAWAFVGTRLLHALIHTGSNNVLTRFRVFVLGVFILVGMWAGILLHLL